MFFPFRGCWSMERQSIETIQLEKSLNSSPQQLIRSENDFEVSLWARQILADLSVAAERTQIVEKDRKKPLESNRMPVLKEAVRVPPN